MSPQPPIDDVETKRRLRRFFDTQLFVLLLIVSVLLLQYAFERLNATGMTPFPGFEWSICALRMLLHIYCPLCGGTRAMLALCQGKLLLSLQYNPVAAYLAVSFAVYDIINIIRILRRAPMLLGFSRLWWIVGITLAALVFVVRNVALIGFGLDNLGDLAPYWTS